MVGLGECRVGVLGFTYSGKPLVTAKEKALNIDFRDLNKLIG